MKNLKSFLIAALLITLKLSAQDCTNSVFTKKGSTIQTTEYGADNEVKAITTITVASVKNNGAEMASDLHKVKSEAGKVTEDKTEHYACSVGNVTWGFGADDSKTKKEASMSYPKNMKPGDDLKTNVFFEYKQTNEKGETVKLAIRINNRKVLAAETVTVKAGAWKCTKITYDFELKIKIGFIGIPIKAKVTEWYSPEVGVVKTETRSKEKLESHSEITALKTK